MGEDNEQTGEENEQTWGENGQTLEEKGQTWEEKGQTWEEDEQNDGPEVPKGAFPCRTPVHLGALLTESWPMCAGNGTGR